MQRIDRYNPKPKRMMVLLDDCRYQFVLAAGGGIETQFLRELVEDDLGKIRKIKEKDSEGPKENRINLVLTDEINEHINKVCRHTGISRSSYMRALIDRNMEES